MRLCTCCLQLKDLNNTYGNKCLASLKVCTLDMLHVSPAKDKTSLRGKLIKILLKNSGFLVFVIVFFFGLSTLGFLCIF